MLAWEYSFVQRLFALCNISTRLTKKGMRANDTQFLLFPLNMLMILFFLFLPIFFFLLRRLLFVLIFRFLFIFSTIKFMLISEFDVFTLLQSRIAQYFKRRSSNGV